MPIKKKFLKSKPICKCTFTVPREAAPDAEKISIVGEFNDWKEDELILKKLKSGIFKIDVDLPVGQKYQYRYLVDGETWINDWEADEYIAAPGLAEENSVVAL
jgi:1,4-alpha-glucan branching enzyme